MHTITVMLSEKLDKADFDLNTAWVLIASLKGIVRSGEP